MIYQVKRLILALCTLPNMGSDPLQVKTSDLGRVPVCDSAHFVKDPRSVTSPGEKGRVQVLPPAKLHSQLAGS